MSETKEENKKEESSKDLNTTPNVVSVQPASLQITNDQVQQVIDGIKHLLNGRKITQALLIRIVANCMVITSRMKLQNHLKKEVVTTALERYIRQSSDLSQEEIDAMMTVVDVLVSDAIDTISDIRKGTIDIQTKTCCVIM